MEREVRNDEVAMVHDDYLGSWDRHINELVDVGNRLKDAERQYNQADDTSKNAFEKRLRVLISEFDQTTERFDLYRKVCNGMIGQTSQEVDADSRTEGKSKQGSDVASGSEQSEEKKKDDDKGVSTDNIDQDLQLGDEKSDE